MNAAQRRERILTRLNSAGAPLSASTLAAELGVSRQIVVGDVALLRAGGAQIDATPRGYQLHPAEKGYTGILACVHRTQEEMRRELYTVVDQGGTVVDVHRIFQINPSCSNRSHNCLTWYAFNSFCGCGLCSNMLPCSSLVNITLEPLVFPLLHFVNSR